MDDKVKQLLRRAYVLLKAYGLQQVPLEAEDIYSIKQWMADCRSYEAAERKIADVDHREETRQ